MTQIRLFFYVILFSLFFSLKVNSANEEKNFSDLLILASGEIHAMIERCECPEEPGGGIAKIATLVDQLRKNYNLLMVDAGGFSAGGIYDDYTEGRKGDSIRTIKMIKAMSIIKYDGIAVGDEEFIYGAEWIKKLADSVNLPLVCTNCFFKKNKKRIFLPYVITQKAGIKIGIAALCTKEKLFTIDTSVVIEDPVVSLKEIWGELTSQTEIQIILSHLGEEEIKKIVENFPECDVIVNGHRKKDSRATSKYKNTAIMQFGFQGKKLSSLMLKKENKIFKIGTSRWYIISPELKDNPIIIDSLKRLEKESKHIDEEYDLYIMSKCPYGLKTLSDFLDFSEKDTSIKWNLWFIGSIEDDNSLSSLNGEKEIYEEKFWLAVKNLYPLQWKSFLRQHLSSPEEPLEKTAQKMNFDTSKITQWISSKGYEALKNHYERTTRLNIRASPTLTINNRLFENEISTINLLKYRCKINKSLHLCDSLPECTIDNECKAPKKIGKCEEKKCKFIDAPVFNFTVVIADSTIEHPEDAVIKTTLELFPGAEIQTITATSAEGKKLLSIYQVDALPTYLFDKKVADLSNFSNIEKGIYLFKDKYIFRKGIVPSNYYLKRKKIKGDIKIYIDPFNPLISDILTIIDNDSLSANIKIEPIIYASPLTSFNDPLETFRMEEALRWLTLQELSESFFWGYLKNYAENPITSYWQVFLKDIGISAEALTDLVNKKKEKLNTLWNTIEELNLYRYCLLYTSD
ncbi:MAG: hypothetical protein N2053_05275, partial [Chitinispirillaceae bacterium]|nr:hypothetical protein [Chitinispirillaceae bacterium]